jgi:hypothetical protein
MDSVNSMTSTSLVVLFAFSFLAVIGIVWFRLGRYRAACATVEGAGDRHAAMQNLLRQDEFDFLAEQGSTAGEVRLFRAERREILRQYVHELAGEFFQLHAEARALVVAAPDAHPELVEQLVGQHLRFWQSLAALEFQLTLDQLGLGQVDPSRLLNLSGSLQEALRRATLAPGPVAV